MRLSGNKSKGRKWAYVVIAFILFIGILIWISIKMNSEDNTAEQVNTEQGVLPGTGDQPSTEDEYIEYEAPATY